MSDPNPKEIEETEINPENIDFSDDDDDEEEFNNDEKEKRTSLMKLVGKAIGMDITRITIPVKYNEPFSFIQRMIEYLQYGDLLAKASQAKDPIVRALYVAIFSVTCYSSTGRTIKPFNPLLGETFEYVDESKGIKYFTEQVSHHPPIGAMYCETDDFVFQLAQRVGTKFLGNSLDVSAVGTSFVHLKKWDEHYSWENIKTVVHNIVIGRMWIDHFGETTIFVKKGDGTTVPIKANLKFQKCGWFGKRWRELTGEVTAASSLDSQYQTYFKFNGKWNESLTATATTLGKKLQNEGGVNFSDGKPHLLWSNDCSFDLDNPRFVKYKWSEFTHELIQIDDNMRKYLPLTDSRLREDRICLEVGDIKGATKSKHVLEEAQRARRRDLENKKEKYVPKYFTVVEQGEGEELMYVYNSKYWEHRRVRALNNEETGRLVTREEAYNFWQIENHKDWREKAKE